MPDVLHDFHIRGSANRVFQSISEPSGLDTWWTKQSSGEPLNGAEYKLWFGPEYVWRTVVSRCFPEKEFELEIVSAQEDWVNTRVGFSLDEKNGATQVRFHHSGWPQENEHYRISWYCWAMYLRLLKRNVEFGEFIEYENRLDV